MGRKSFLQHADANFSSYLEKRIARFWMLLHEIDRQSKEPCGNFSFKNLLLLG